MFQMLAKKVKLVSVAVGVAASFALASPAQAALYSGDWDPAFGSAFPDLGWRGDATFFIPDACVGLSGWVFNFGQCSGMKILEAEVEFYSLSDPASTTLETLVFDVPSTAVGWANLDDGQLLGVIGAFPYFRLSMLDIAGGDYTKFFLSFVDDFPVLIADPPGPHNTVMSDITPQGRPTITFRVVPEPGALALLGLGLGMIGLMTRQKRREPSEQPSSAT